LEKEYSEIRLVGQRKTVTVYATNQGQILNINYSILDLFQLPSQTSGLRNPPGHAFVSRRNTETGASPKETPGL